MNWFKKFEICKNCKCICVCKDNLIVRKLTKRLSRRHTVQIKMPEFLYEWGRDLNLEDKEEIAMYQKAVEKWEQHVTCIQKSG